MIKRLFLSVFLMVGLFGTLAFGQGPDPYRPKFALKYAPLAIFDRTPSIQFATEIATFKHQAIQLEGGYIKNIFKEPSNDFNGFKLRAGYRFYLHRSTNLSRNGFIGLLYMYKQVMAEGTANVWRNARSYQEAIDIRVFNQTNGFYAQIGQVFARFIGPLSAELVMGGGIRLLDVSLKDVPEDVELDAKLTGSIWNFNPVTSDGFYTLPGFFLTFRLIYPFS